MNAIQILGAIIGHTPIWVFAVFAMLIFLGAQALRPRNMPLRRILITPAIFIIWGIEGLVTKPNFSGLLAADWVAGILIGAAFAGLIARFPDLRADHAAGRVLLPPSMQPLVRNIVIFLTKYALGVAMAMAPLARDHLIFWDVAVSGLSAGYFIGWLVRLIAAYRHAPALATPGLAVAEGAL